MIHYFDASQEEAEDRIREAGFPAFRARQLREWVYEKDVLDPGSMGNLGKAFRSFLEEEFRFRTIRVLKVLKDPKGETIKFLLELEDKNTLEMVIMRYLNRDASKERNTLCLSSQVGCPVGCPFCATGQSGLVRNLRTGEILEQVALANEYLKETGTRIGNVVFMGMGEPLLNKENVFRAVDGLHRDFGISSRRITLSTSGHVDGIRAMADAELKVVLAISLHGAEDALRDQLVPLNRKYPLASLMDACRYYQKKTGKRITFEYILIDGVNIGESHARELAALLKGIDCHINGIPINAVEGSAFKRPSRNAVYRFKSLCEGYGLSFSVREEKGQEIEGACGQLRNQERNKHESNRAK